MSEVDPNGLNQHQAGAKLDAGKIDMSLLTLWPRALTEVCRVGTLGASKYSRGGFLSVADGYIRYTAALLRHMFKETVSTMDDDPYYDTEAGAPYKGKIRHDAQVAWNALSRLEVKLREEEDNERKQQQEQLKRVAGFGQADAVGQGDAASQRGRFAGSPSPLTNAGTASNAAGYSPFGWPYGPG